MAIRYCCDFCGESIPEASGVTLFYAVPSGVGGMERKLSKDLCASCWMGMQDYAKRFTPQEAA